MSDNRLLELRGVKKYFPLRKSLTKSKAAGWIKAIDGIDFVINEGETFGLVGESGCGKTTTSKVILLLEKATAGEVLFDGKDIARLRGDSLAQYRRHVQAVFQDPTSSLSPRMRVGEIVSEPIIARNPPPRSEVKDRVAAVLQQVGLSPASASLFPHEFSGGQRQRIAVARALSTSPKCIILDEPVSALDVSIKAQILNLLKDLQEELGLTYLMIAHDLAAVRYLSNRIGVMYLGKLVEVADSGDLYRNALHPYTKALLSAALTPSPDDKHTEIIVRGEVPSPAAIPAGCRFHPRCPQAMPLCSEVEPPLRHADSNHEVACHLYR